MVLLQLIAAAALPSADAVLEAQRIGLPLHVESPHNEECPASHGHVFCQVVHSLAAASTVGDIGLLVHRSPALVVGVTPRQHEDIERRPSLRGPTAPRPPPLG